MGIRIALGVRRSTVLAEVMKQGLMLTGFDIIAGLIGAFGLNRLITSLLFGVTSTDTVTFLIVITTILLAGVIACGLPAWRAARLNPNVVLRAE